MGRFNNLFKDSFTEEKSVIPTKSTGRFKNLFNKSSSEKLTGNILIDRKTPAFTGQSQNPLKTLWRGGIVQPAKTFMGGIDKATAEMFDLIDFYAGKAAEKLGKPELKPQIFSNLKDIYEQEGSRLQEEGVQNKFTKALYSGLGQAAFDVPVKYMGPGKFLKGATLPTLGAIEGFKGGGVKGAATGAASGALMKGTLTGMGTLPTKIKLPTAFGIGATTTPGGPEEKIAGGAVFTGLSLGGKSPTMGQFRETLRRSPITTIAKQILPAERAEGLYQNFINRMQSIENTVAKAKSLGAKILPGEDAGKRARGYLGIGAKVRSVLEDKTYRITPEGKIQITGEGLKPILTNYDKLSPEKNRNIREKDLTNYLIAQRTIKDLQRPKSKFTKKNIVTPEQVNKAQNIISELNTKYKGNLQHIEQTANRLYDYQKRILLILVDSGNLSQKQFNTILTKNPNYVPFDRMVEGIEPTGAMPVSKRRFTSARAPIKRIKGSELEIQNPVESMIKNTYRIMDIAERNTVARNIAKLSSVLPEEISPLKIKMKPVRLTKKEAGEAKTIFRPSQFKPKGNVIEYFENGKRSYIEVTSNLYQAMTGLNETSVNLVTKILSMPAHTLRVGATITPEFMVRNPLRDQLTALMQTKLGFKPFVDTTGAIADILGKSKHYNDWLRSGGAYSGFVELSRPKLKIMLADLKNKPNLLKSLNIITRAQDISQLMEQATRVGVYKAGIKKGLTPIEAGFESREATLDFARKGAKTKDFNAIVAFFNAGVQATDKLARTAKDDPVGFTAKGIATITIPSLISYMANKDDPGYKELPRWQKDLFWIFKAGDTYVRIPKPFAYGQIFGSVPERFFEYLDSQDPKAFEGLQKSLYESLSPVSGDPMSGLLPTGIKPLIENQANWSFFRQRSVIPAGKERLKPSEQYGRFTSETAKFIGKALNVSPAKIENLASGYFGGSGRYALEAADKAGALFTGQPIEKKPTELADIPLVKGFVTRSPYASSESLNQFYKNKKKAEEAYLTYRKLRNENRNEEAKKLIDTNKYYKYYKTFNKFAQTISKVNDQIDKVEKSSISVDQKRKEIDRLEKQKTAFAKQANMLIK